jgi:hypothetical protein
MKFQLLALSAFAGYVSATTYAQFCDDTACTENCGISVSTDNPGCLNESGRHSIKFHDSNIQDVRLVFSPEPNCKRDHSRLFRLCERSSADSIVLKGPCQSECVDVVGCGEGVCGALYECYDLTGHHDAQSFRFVGGSTCGAYVVLCLFVFQES